MANTKIDRSGGPDVPATSSRDEIDTFLRAVRVHDAMPGQGRGRLIFALDATMSRQPTWDMACTLQADMFREAATAGSLDVQLVYYRGLAECRTSQFVSSSAQLLRLMESIDCRGGHTQIGRVLTHARQETGRVPVRALVFVGDAMEESLDDLCAAAGELGLLGVKAFMFQEGHDPIAEQAFRQVAKLSGGAYCRFAPGAADELRALLRAVAAYAAGGMASLRDLSQRDSGARALLTQFGGAGTARPQTGRTGS